MYIGRFSHISVLLSVLAVAFAGTTYLYTSSLSNSLLVILGFILATIDTGIGMGYGTMGTPILLIAGFSSKNVVPAILVSQLFAASIGSIQHRRYKNTNVLDLKGKDAKMALTMIAFGIAGALIAVWLAMRLSGEYINMYIGLLVVSIGIVILLKKRATFSWTKLYILSIIGGFNKAISGGGYGPVSTGGLLTIGQKIKKSVGITIFSIAIINLVGFLLYLISGSISDYAISLYLSIGAVLGSNIGPRITRQEKAGNNLRGMAVLIIVLGLLTLLSALKII